MTVTATADQKLRPKSGRKPLHPINSPITTTPKPKAKQEWKDQIALDKENNHHQVKMETLDASLVEELSAIRKKMERLRLDKGKQRRCWRKERPQWRPT
ncbi:hypothetical protein Ddye_023614 [Dipteronia dyeriana]|uniref:Uncharacterized protein n=1 Tax=Dipteronia dyeriana TaxID=168575 RepID=A0AAD9WST6_9ROSI|nr:hypothetical protein Ddye_023614 [Dipteronia dyeriana]